MLLSIAGAVVVATLVVVAAHALRERRALAADLRALRADVRRLARALEARGAPTRDEKAASTTATRGGAVTADEHAVQARGSRTLH